MEDQIVQTQESVQQPASGTVQPVVEKKTESVLPEPDLLTKVSKYKKQEVPVKENSDSFFDYKEIENIKDPIAKEVAIKAYKSMQSDYTKKTIDISNVRKSSEEKISSLEKQLQQDGNWTPERIQQLLNNPQFLTAAQQVAKNQNPQGSGLTDEQYSALSDREKSEMNALSMKVNQLEQANYQSLINQQDVQLKSKYEDYNSTKIDESLATLAKVSPHQLREYVYKATLHDDHVKNAYDMGLQDGANKNKEKISAFSPSGGQAVNGDNTITKDKGETDASFFVRLAQNRLAQFRKK